MSGAATIRPLRLLDTLLERLHADHILYCNWKSNEHLRASMAGDSDLDLLVEPAAAARLARILAETGCKRFLVASGQRHPGVEDYLGFDAETGRLIHLHIHYQLTLGEKFLKGYRLPWESEVLATRVLDSEHGIYVADPHAELLLLVVRAAIKLRARDVLRAASGRPYLAGDLLRELRWLARRVEPERLHALARPLIGDRAARHLQQVAVAPAPSLRQLIALRRSATPPLHTHRMYPALEAWARRWGKEGMTIARAVTDYYLGMPRRSTRTRPQGGCTVALLGGEPGLRRAVARRLTDWLATEAAVLHVDGAAAARQRQAARRARRARDSGLIVVWEGVPPAAALGPPELVLRLPGAAGRPIDTPARVVDVAEASLEDVLLEVKRALWDSL